MGALERHLSGVHGEGWACATMQGVAHLGGEWDVASLCEGGGTIFEAELARHIHRYGRAWCALGMGLEPRPLAHGARDVCLALLIGAGPHVRAELGLNSPRDEALRALEEGGGSWRTRAAMEVEGDPPAPPGIPPLAHAATVPISKLHPATTCEDETDNSLAVEVLERSPGAAALLREGCGVHKMCRFLGIDPADAWLRCITNGLMASETPSRALVAGGMDHIVPPPLAEVANGPDGAPEVHITWWAPSFDTDRDGRTVMVAPERRVTSICWDGECDADMLTAMRQPCHLPARPGGRRHHAGVRAEAITELGVEVVACAAARAGTRGIAVRSPEAQWVVAAEPLWPSGAGGAVELRGHGGTIVMDDIDHIDAHCLCAIAGAAGELARSLGCPLVMPRPQHRAAAVGLEHIGASRVGASHVMII